MITKRTKSFDGPYNNLIKAFVVEPCFLRRNVFLFFVLFVLPTTKQEFVKTYLCCYCFFSLWLAVSETRKGKKEKDDLPRTDNATPFLVARKWVIVCFAAFSSFVWNERRKNERKERESFLLKVCFWIFFSCDRNLSHCPLWHEHVVKESLNDFIDVAVKSREKIFNMIKSKSLIQIYLFHYFNLTGGLKHLCLTYLLHKFSRLRTI